MTLKKYYTVTVGCSLEAYADIDVLAESQADAERITRNDIVAKGWKTRAGGAHFLPDWDGSDDLRVCE